MITRLLEDIKIKLNGLVAKLKYRKYKKYSMQIV